ncbi:hypothetical protein D9758_006956 [Tetrapyrgos nigripes]|uniref:DhaK domain-containing protein n=1 Tax=Tetrapyrgos nigripes TaxID=182062 RepID=A0A8H5LUZ2_9AGAR|nr:hypothetical protein D9758_006956 [Tetrapyrgos nigripes]
MLSGVCCVLQVYLTVIVTMYYSARKHNAVYTQSNSDSHNDCDTYISLQENIISIHASPPPSSTPPYFQPTYALHLATFTGTDPNTPFKQVLAIINNYMGDRLNFGSAIEKAKVDGLTVENIVVADVTSISPAFGRPDQRTFLGWTQRFWPESGQHRDYASEEKDTAHTIYLSHDDGGGGGGGDGSFEGDVSSATNNHLTTSRLTAHAALPTLPDKTTS